MKQPSVDVLLGGMQQFPHKYTDRSGVQYLYCRERCGAQYMLTSARKSKEFQEEPSRYMLIVAVMMKTTLIIIIIIVIQ